MIKSKNSKKKSKSLKDRIDLYPKKISKELIEWSKNFTNEIHLLDESTSKYLERELFLEKILKN